MEDTHRVAEHQLTVEAGVIEELDSCPSLGVRKTPTLRKT